MKAERKYILIGMAMCILLGPWSARAQQDVGFTQYGSNPVPFNPAASLLAPEGEVGFIGRRQWVGVEGAPEAYWLSGHMGLEKARMTIGVNVRHEKLAVEQTSEVSAFAAKAIRISESEYLSLSLNLGWSYYRGNFSQVDPMDPAFVNKDLRQTDAVAGFGVMLYRPDRYYVGVSMPRLSLSELGNGGANRDYRFYNQYYVTAGMLQPLGEDFSVKPALLVAYSPNLKTRVEASALLWVKQAIGLGMNIRTSGDLAGIIQLNTGRFGIGYSYQFNPGSKPLNRQINNATHEVSLNYYFGTSHVGLL